MRETRQRSCMKSTHEPSLQTTTDPCAWTRQSCRMLVAGEGQLSPVLLLFGIILWWPACTTPQLDVLQQNESSACAQQVSRILLSITGLKEETCVFSHELYFLLQPPSAPLYSSCPPLLHRWVDTCPGHHASRLVSTKSPISPTSTYLSKQGRQIVKDQSIQTTTQDTGWCQTLLLLLLHRSVVCRCKSKGC